jgi:hypothetical protein
VTTVKYSLRTGAVSGRASSLTVPQQSGRKFCGSANNGRRGAPLPVNELETIVSDGLTDLPQNTTEIEMLEAKESWSVYRLADGTTLRIKPVMIAVFRADGVNTQDGEPVYNMKSTLITDVRASAAAIKSG